MSIYTTSAPFILGAANGGILSSFRGSFVNTFPSRRAEHRDGQCAMFAAARTAGVPTTPQFRDSMLAAINAYLGLQISSRTQLTPEEQREVTRALEAGLWNTRWEIAVRATSPRAWVLAYHLTLDATREAEMQAETRAREVAEAEAAPEVALSNYRAAIARLNAVNA